MTDLFIENGKAGKIWDFFLPKIGNLYGTAALLGYIYYESSMDPKCLQNPSGNMSESEYTDAVDSGKYTLSEFRKDDIRYGLFGWKLWYRKQSLYNRAKLAEKSVGDLEIQLNYIWEELSGVTSRNILEALKNATDCSEPSKTLYGCLHDLNSINESYDTNALALCNEYANSYYTAFVENKSKLVPVSYIRITSKKAALRRYCSIVSKRITIGIKDEEYQYLTTSKNNMWYSVFLEGHNKVGWIHKSACTEPFERMEKR